MSAWRLRRRDGAEDEEVFSAEKTSVLHKDMLLLFHIFIGL